MMQAISAFFRKLYTGFFSNLPIRRRVFALFLLTSILPLMLACVITFFNTYASTRELLSRTMTESNARILREISATRRSVEALSDQIVSSLQLQEFLHENYLRHPADADTKKVIRNDLASMVDYNDIISIVIADDDGVLLASNTTAMSFGANAGFLHSPLFASRSANNRKCCWSYMPNDVFSFYHHSGFLYICRNIYYYLSPGVCIGTLVVQCSDDLFLNSFESDKSLAGDELFLLMNDEGEVLASTNEDAFPCGSAYPEIQALTDNAGAEILHAPLNGSDQLIVQSHTAKNGWAILHALPYSYITGHALQSGASILLIMAIFIVLVVALSYMLSNEFIRPIHQLKHCVQEFGKGNLAVRMPETRSDELGELQVGFNHMSTRIVSLMDSIEDQYRQRRKLELQIMEYQIVPHFLYNSLDSISWMALSNNDPEVSQSITALARYFRISLSSGKEIHSVGMELKHIEYYMQICNMRYQGCFRFQVTAPPELETLSVLKMILQPVIENAVKYSLDKASPDNTISVDVSGGDGHLVFRIEDNGPGTDPAALEALQQNIDACRVHSEKGGFGLVNVNRRIHLYYGPAYGIRLANRSPHGMTVTIEVPVLPDTPAPSASEWDESRPAGTDRRD